MTKQKTPQAANRRFNRKWIGLAILGFFIVLTFVVSAAFLGYQKNVTVMVDAVRRARAEVLEKHGGIVKSGPVITHGESLWTGWLCIDTNCPQVETEWYVPIDPTQYNAFEDEVIAKIHESGSWNVNLFTGEVMPKDLPSNAATNKKWADVRIFVY